MAATLNLSREADELDVVLRTRRLPASLLTEEQRDGARELIDLGLARTFRDGPDEWLETILPGDGDLEEEIYGQLVVPVPGHAVGTLDLRPTLF